jgi:hypothetical protein
MTKKDPIQHPHHHLLLLFLFFFLFSPLATVQGEEPSLRESSLESPSYTFGVGVENNGVSYRVFLLPSLRLSGFLNFAVGKINRFTLTTQVLYHDPLWTLEGGDTGQFDFYTGLGIQWRYFFGVGIALRIPLGVEYPIPHLPLMAFAEYTPLFTFLESGESFFTFQSGEGTLGILYRF